jgi:hypothetical protein
MIPWRYDGLDRAIGAREDLTLLEFLRIGG